MQTHLALRAWLQDIKKAAASFVSDGHMTHAAALSFYGLFSLPPLTMLLLRATGTFFHVDTAKAQVVDALEQVVGTKAAHLLADNLQAVSHASFSTLSTVLGILALLISASSVFSTLQTVLNKIFGTRPHYSGRHAALLFAQRRLVSLGLVLLISLTLVVSIVLETGMALVSGWVARKMPLAAQELPWLGSTGISLLFMWILCLLFFKVLPDIKIPWPECMSGAVLSVALFAVVKFPVRFYLTTIHPENIYHAAGSIILMMFWIHCASGVFLLGALFTHQRCLRNGSLPPSTSA